ncbi:MAG: metallophosphoesterase [Acidobacteriota bacterium]|nr:metallophosphoesterase [Acidobacteriota bacterium]
MRTLVHISDLHFGRIDPNGLGPLREAIVGAKPDLIALSGDFTQRAKVSEFIAAREFLDSLVPPKLVVPGNHDVPLWNVFARFLTPLTRYRRYISPELAPEYEDEEMIVLGVNTARSWTWGEGRINAAQVARIVERLAVVKPSLIRIIVTHHPFDLPPGVDTRRLLGRAKMAMAQLATANADLFLSGHLHLSHASHSAERYKIEGHSALIVQAGTVSLRGRGEQPTFNVLRIERPNITLARQVWDPDARCFTESAVAVYRHTTSGWVTEPAAEAAPGVVSGVVSPGA